MKISRTIPIFLIATILVFGTTISMGIPASFALYSDLENEINIEMQNEINEESLLISEELIGVYVINNILLAAGSGLGAINEAVSTINNVLQESLENDGRCMLDIFINGVLNNL